MNKILHWKPCLLLLTPLVALSSGGCQKKPAPPQAEEQPAAAQPAPPPLHPEFDLTREELEAMTADLPEGIREGILNRGEAFLSLVAELLDQPEELLVLVNKQTGLNAEDNPDDLVDLDDFGDRLVLSRPGHKLRELTLPALLTMTEAARREGLSLMVSSAYRSYQYQDKLYARYVARDGQEAADRYSARPGSSQHQLGTVIDFGSIDESFAATPAGMWLKEHAGEYGFSLSYPEGMEDLTGYMGECWHYRYLSPAGTRMEKEFFQGIQEHMLRFFHTERRALREARL